MHTHRTMPVRVYPVSAFFVGNSIVFMYE